MRCNKVSRRQILKDKRAASPAISMVIITAATVVLVLVAGGFAVQVLDRQQATTEFDAMQKSILAFDDAVRDVAGKHGASRSVRFVTNHGSFQTISDIRSFSIKFNGAPLVDEYKTSVITYRMPDSYITLGSGYSSYILGNEDLVVSSVSQSLGQVVVAQESGFASISLGYRVRVSSEGSSIEVEGKTVNYVNVMIIELDVDNLSIHSGEFDLVAKNIKIESNPVVKPVSSSGYYTITVSEGEESKDVSLYLESGDVVFNIITYKVRVSP